MEEKRAVAGKERQVVGRLDSFCGLRQEGKKETVNIQVKYRAYLELPRSRSGGNMTSKVDGCQELGVLIYEQRSQ